jgi:hypothetical protein
MFRILIEEDSPGYPLDFEFLLDLRRLSSYTENRIE